LNVVEFPHLMTHHQLVMVIIVLPSLCIVPFDLLAFQQLCGAIIKQAYLAASRDNKHRQDAAFRDYQPLAVFRSRQGVQQV
jgi:hypothetical protein